MTSAKPLNPKNNFGVLVAAGKGRRFGGLKQFVQIHGKPLFFYCARSFELCPSVTSFVIVTNFSRVSTVKKWVKQWGWKKVLMVVAGGPERMDSVERGLLALPEDGYVAIQDGVRPLLKPEHLTLGFRLCRHYPAIAFGSLVTDTLKEVCDGKIVKTIDRSKIALIHTPQFFSLRLIRQAFSVARAKKLVATDECRLVEELGISPKVINGGFLNIKVTVKEDLRLCEALLCP